MSLFFGAESRNIAYKDNTSHNYCCCPNMLLVFSSMLMYGCTRLEIGVQSVYEDVARDTNR